MRDHIYDLLGIWDAVCGLFGAAGLLLYLWTLWKIKPQIELLRQQCAELERRATELTEKLVTMGIDGDAVTAPKGVQHAEET